MFSVSDFIDSRDVREYNKNTVFTPLEQAVIIYCSESRDIRDKLAAWKELLSTYSEEDFRATGCGAWDFVKDREGKVLRSNKKIIENHVAECEAAFERLNQNEGIVYVASFWNVETEGRDDAEKAYFSGFEAAVQYIVDRKKEYSDYDDTFGKCRTCGSIVRTHLDSDKTYRNDTYMFNNEMIMYTVYPNGGVSEDDFDGGLSDNQDIRMGMDIFYIWVPLPFKKGDLLKCNGWHGTFYGVLGYDPTDPALEFGLNCLDMSDLFIRIEEFEKCGAADRAEHCHGHFNPLQIEYCPASELPKDHRRMLLYLSDAYKDSREIGYLLEVYTDYLAHYPSTENILESRLNEELEKEKAVKK